MQPAYYEDFKEIKKKIWSMLNDAVTNRSSPFRIPVFISEVLISVTQVFWMPLAEIVEPDKDNILMKKINSKLKSWVKKLNKPGHAIYDSHDVRKVKVGEWEYL